MPTPNLLLTAAREYADRFNWAVIPVLGKESACQWKKYQLNRPGPRHLIGLFSIPNVTGLAALVGEVSNGLRVRDFDHVPAYHAWAAAHPDLAATLPTSKTARGFHVFFRADLPEGVTYFADGELRAGGGYVVLPPSAHPDGGAYEWVVPPEGAIPLVTDVDAAGLSGQARSVTRDVPPAVEEAIAKTLPTGHGQRVRQLWHFARRLKGIPGLDTSPAALAAYIRAWHEHARPFIKTTNYDATELAFYDAWTNAKAPLTDDQFLVWARVVLEGPDPDWLTAVYFPEAGKRLLRVCESLQARAGDEPFFLAARSAAVAASVEPTIASKLLKRLVDAGYLEVVEKGAYVTGKATTWRFRRPVPGPFALAC